MFLVKARLLDIAIISNQGFSNDKNLSEKLVTSEFKALKRLSKSKNFIIQKGDKDNTIVILQSWS